MVEPAHYVLKRERCSSCKLKEFVSINKKVIPLRVNVTNEPKILYQNMTGAFFSPGTDVQDEDDNYQRGDANQAVGCSSSHERFHGKLQISV